MAIWRNIHHFWLSLNLVYLKCRTSMSLRSPWTMPTRPTRRRIRQSNVTRTNTGIGVVINITCKWEVELQNILKHREVEAAFEQEARQRQEVTAIILNFLWWRWTVSDIVPQHLNCEGGRQGWSCRQTSQCIAGRTWGKPKPARLSGEREEAGGDGAARHQGGHQRPQHHERAGCQREEAAGDCRAHVARRDWLPPPVGKECRGES